MVCEMRLYEKLLVIFIVVHLTLTIITLNPFGFLHAATVEKDDFSLVGYDSNEEEDSESDTDVLGDYHEPFDPEKNGLLLHEYYNKVYEKYPDYDTSTMKQNLNYFGDVLLLGKDRGETGESKEEVTLGDQFVLDPSEREQYLKVNDTDNDGDNGENGDEFQEVDDARDSKLTSYDDSNSQMDSDQIDDWSLDK